MKDRDIKFVLAIKKTSETTVPTTPQIASEVEFNKYLRTFYQPILDKHKVLSVKFIRESELSGPGTVIGYGVSGACYLRTWNGQQVAVKSFLFGNSEKNSVAWHMSTVSREAILTFGMNHPNVCKLLGCGFGNNGVFLVLEYAGDAPKAETRFSLLLQQSKPQNGLYPSIGFLELLRDIAAGLSYAHNEHDVIHRDIQLQNVLVHSDGRGMVADWGQAKEVDDPLKILRGSCRHYAPESLARQKKGQAPYTRASDVFMYGTVMFEAAQGKRFWADWDTGEACAKTLAGMLPDISPYKDQNGHEFSFSEDYVELSKSCMSFKASDRPSFDEVVARLDAMIQRRTP